MQVQLELERPRLVGEETSPRALDQGRYQQVYAFRGPPGATLLQQVTTVIELRRGEQVLVGYRGRYLEYFHLDAEGRAQHDTHDLSLRRDGWDPAAVRRLLRRYGLQAGSSAESLLHAVKTFRLGLGEVRDELVHCQPRAGEAGGAFGFVAEGPAPVGAALWVSSVDGSGERSLEPESPCPFGARAAGSAEFSDSPGWIAREVFDFRYTTRTGAYSDGGGYTPSLLAPFNVPTCGAINE